MHALLTKCKAQQSFFIDHVDLRQNTDTMDCKKNELQVGIMILTLINNFHNFLRSMLSLYAIT